MHEGKLVWIVGLWVLTLSSCFESDIDFNFPYEEKPVAFGFLDSIWGVRAWVGKTAQVISADSNVVSNSIAYLYDERGLLQQLKHAANGLFFSSNFRPVEGKKYQFKTQMERFPQLLTSEFISLPPVIPIRSVLYKKRNDGSSGVDLFIELEDPDGFNAYGFYFQRFFRDTPIDSGYASDPLFLPFYSGLLSDREFNNRKFTVLRENIPLDISVNGETVSADSLKITMFNFSKSMYDLFLSLNTPEPGSGDPFFDPTIISNSSEHGIIVFGSYSQHATGIAIK